ncbi:hypothetical protein GH714_035936 [Hevea brasiliensis]|uniref:Uncharacterized protein n=1 Tax=Hevea brasiliensis TaxID=3981 RepID=A0A6A6NCQ9_HEVBR|nr:hypothetical protein GH714_035936 [Hevea brasiliensis]
MAGIVVVFDFDKTIIDVDSDNWVIDELGFTDLFNQLLPTMPWNSLMDRMMKELRSQGKTIDDIVEVLKRTPIHPRIVPAIQSAHALGCELRIVSDANLFFIETILKHLGLRDYFSEINTNSGFVDEEGRLRIPYHDFTRSSHGCSRCPPNMCKGLIIERIQASLAKEGNKKIIYLGDGVEIHEWIDGEELERVLLQVIGAISMEESNEKSAQLFSADCKLQTITIGAHEAFPKALAVPQ